MLAMTDFNLLSLDLYPDILTLFPVGTIRSDCSLRKSVTGRLDGILPSKRWIRREVFTFFHSFFM